MYRLITHTSKRLYPRTIDELFRLRRQVFVDEQKWTQFDVDGIYEKDDYDTEDCVYAVAIGAREEVIGGFRLFPTTLPHMLSDAFPYLIEGAPISRPDVMEVSRFHLASEYRSSKAHFLEGIAALLEVSIEFGLSGLTGVMRTNRLPVLAEVGIQIEPLGMPADIEGVSSSALLIHTTEECLSAVNSLRGTTFSVLEHNQQRLRRA